MKTTQHLELLNLSLDGEASPEQQRVIEQLLAIDTDAKKQFAALQQLFNLLAELKNQAPPIGLASTIIANSSPFMAMSVVRDGRNERNLHNKIRKPFWRSSVFVSESMGTRRSWSGMFTRKHRVLGQFSTTEEFKMDEH